MNKEDSSIAQLLKLAGTRDMPSQSATERARAAAEAAWQRGLRQPARPLRGRRLWIPLALAASSALVAVLLLNRPAPRAALVVASVVAVDADPEIRGDSAAMLRAGARVHEGVTVSTGRGRAAFQLGDSLSLRADRDTQIEFVSEDRLRLAKGSVYVDSGGLNAVSRLRIETPAGEVRHLGTQFLVSVEGAATRIRVREGRVELARPGAPAQDIAAGDGVDVEGGRMQLLRGLASHGGEWEWVTSTAPAFDIENRPLSEFLAWVSREHGWQLAYRDEEIRVRAQDIRLHGTVSGLEVQAMLERIALITGVSLRVEAGVLQVDPA